MWVGSIDRSYRFSEYPVAIGDVRWISASLNLIGEVSFDPDGGTLTYAWEIVTAPSGSPGTVNSVPLFSGTP